MRIGERRTDGSNRRRSTTLPTAYVFCVLAEPDGELDAWLVTDERGELMREIRRLARARGLEPVAKTYSSSGLTITRRRVVHTSHDAFGYLIEAAGGRVIWAPEFFEFPRWVAGADLMFAEVAGWDRPIRFRDGAGGHASALEVPREAQRRGVRRLILAHIGRPTIRAIDAGLRPPFGEFGEERKVYNLRRTTRSANA